MDQENQMNIVVKEFNKFNKKTLLSKTRMPENVRFPILKAERKTTKVGESIALELDMSTFCTCRKGTPLFKMISSMKWLMKNLIFIKVMTICI